MKRKAIPGSTRGMVGCVLLTICSHSHADTKVIGYLPNWNDLSLSARSIAYSKLTHINIAFENPMNPMGDLSFHAGCDVVISAAHAHKVKVLVSIGGASVSEDANQRAGFLRLITASKRTAFITKLIKYTVTHNFDGIDVDLEGPAINADYGGFIHDLAARMKASKKLITAALSQGYGGNAVPNEALGQLDWVNIMAYDAVGPWDPKTPGQHASLDYAKNNVNYWLSRGLPKTKAMLGIPFYGYGFGKAFRADEYAYREIVQAYPGAEKADVAGTTIWYNGAATVAAKVRYARAAGLAGVMIWPLDSDAPGEKSLLTVIANTISRTP